MSEIPSNSTTSPEYWNGYWHDTTFSKVSTDHPLSDWLERFVPDGESKSCFEIGCYPGKFLTLLGDKGYELNGTDLYRGGADALSGWLSNEGYDVGNIYEEDFSTLDTTETYDVTCSFGFMEHFDNFPDLLSKQVKMTKDNGLVIVEVPNLASPIYRSLYRILEPSVLRNHVPEVMNLNNIKNAVGALGLDIVQADYVGNFFFRFVDHNSKTTQAIESAINSLRPLADRLSKSASARYIGVIATKQPCKMRRLSSNQCADRMATGNLGNVAFL